MEADDFDTMMPTNGPNPFFDTWDKHNSIAFSSAKGLRNAPGENNCFVNSAVQVFWHLDVFRRSYRRLTGHVCMNKSCIFCALKAIFTQFQFSDQTSLQPDSLRKALADTFANEQRFQLRHMDDAAECFENILRRIHCHIAYNHNEDTCTAPHCLPHQKFSLNIVEKVMCPCGSSSEPLAFNEMVHYISAKALNAQARQMQETGDVLHPDRFGLLLRNANAVGDIRECPGSCGKKVQIRRTLLNSPDVVSIGLVWDSDHPTVEMTTEVARNIGTTILMQDVFHSVQQDPSHLPKLQLVGLVCYYGKHYSTFVFHSKLQVWIYFDDATVREIGPRWEDVVDKCSKGRYQPLLLLYANPNATPIPMETAPKKRTMAPGYGIPGGPEEENPLDRTHESISSQQSSQRSRTPVAELTRQQMNNSPYQRSGEEKVSDHTRQQSFILAMSKPDKARPLRYGGQSSNHGGMPGPMMPVSGAVDQTTGQQKDTYSDYTLSTSDQYRRPTMANFEPSQLPVTNIKNFMDGQRKESFKKDKEPVRADVVRYPQEPSKSQLSNNYYSNQVQQYQTHNYEPSNGQYYHPNSRQRSVSQGYDEAYASDTSNYEGGTQHTVVKPMVNSQNYDYVDSMNQSHTPVQSGLATLPRTKKESFVVSDNYTSSNRHSGNLFNPTGLPPPGPGKLALDKSLDSDKKSKKLKKELKKSDKKTSKTSLGKHQSDEMNKAALHSYIVDSTMKPEDSLEQKLYIDRKMVENVLKQQGLQRQPSTHSTNSHGSSSSIESDSLLGRLIASRASEGSVTTDVSFDNVSLGSHKDSGYGSSDRNSSSSTGSGTIEPHVQYFISKSMVVPRNFNPQWQPQQPQPMVTNFAAIDPQPFEGSTLKDVSSMSKEELGRHLYETLSNRKVMHPIKESSQEDILKLLPKEDNWRDQPSPYNGLEPTGRPPPIPPKNFAAFQVSKSAHQREASIESLDKSEVKNEYFLKMCEKADDLMDRCVIAETQGDLSTALIFCDSALDCLKEAMNQSDIPQKAQSYAEKTHNACLLKSRSLYKRNSEAQGGKRSSITSSDSDNSDRPVSRVTRERRPALRNGQQMRTTQAPGVNRGPQLDTSSGSSRSSPLPPALLSAKEEVGHTRMTSSSPLTLSNADLQTASRYSSSDKSDTEGGHIRSGSNTSIRSSASVSSSLSQNVSLTNVTMSSRAQQSSRGSPPVNQPLDSYGTLSRNRKPRRTSDPTSNSDAYQMYLSRQKAVQGSSGFDLRESDSSSGDGSAGQKLQTGTKLPDPRTMLGSKNNYDNAGQRGSTSSCGSSGSNFSSVSQTSSSLADRALQYNITQQQQGQAPTRSSPSIVQSSFQQQPSSQTVDQSRPSFANSQQIISGYNQPLPGHRSTSNSQYLGNGQSAQPLATSNGQVYGQQTSFNPIQSQSRVTEAQLPKPPHQLSSSQSSSNIASQYMVNDLNKPAASLQQSAAQKLSHSVQNLSIGRNGPPPPPPTRTTSTLGLRHSQQLQDVSHPTGTSPPKNVSVARILPNSHITQGTDSRMSGSPTPAYRQPMAAITSSQLKHAASTTALNVLPSVPRPLERCASQLDCQNLVETVSTSFSKSDALTSTSTFVSGNQQNTLPTHQEHLSTVKKVLPTSDDMLPQQSVRSLASQFDKQVEKPAIKPKPITLIRSRSKSESGNKKPKSVLKSKKSKGKTPRKSVTFADNLCDLASGYESAAELTSFSSRTVDNDRAYFSEDDDLCTAKSDNELDDVEDSSNSDDYSLVREEFACHLCRKREFEPGRNYCSKCSLYMKRLSAQQREHR
uniref:USP domain-containing protein n=1 Tax=Biomphalaria glabrata TaxID=6526 RepID=A0A2C9M693_BIOGL